MNTLYRICTENKNRPEVEALVSKYAEGFTILEGRGYWNGVAEESLIIEIAGDNTIGLAIRLLANEIKALNAQEAILLEVIPMITILV